jgi:hypothetical protein
MKIKCVFFFVFFFLAKYTESYAGNKEMNLSDLQEKYKKDHAIYLAEKEHVHIKTRPLNNESN